MKRSTMLALLLGAGAFWLWRRYRALPQVGPTFNLPRLTP